MVIKNNETSLDLDKILVFQRNAFLIYCLSINIQALERERSVLLLDSLLYLWLWQVVKHGIHRLMIGLILV